MKLIDTRPQRLHCPICSETYAVPQNGSIRPYKEVKCPLDEFDLVLWTQGPKSRVSDSPSSLNRYPTGLIVHTYTTPLNPSIFASVGQNLVFCPYCYSHPPFEDMLRSQGCNRCPHPSCPRSMENLGVDACPDCPYGILVLDDSAAPKYRLFCNRQVAHWSLIPGDRVCACGFKPSDGWRRRSTI